MLEVILRVILTKSENISFSSYSKQNIKYIIIFQSGGNSEKIWVHRFFWKQKAEVPETCISKLGGSGKTTLFF